MVHYVKRQQSTSAYLSVRKLGNEKEWRDYVRNINYNGYKINLAEYGEYKETVCKRGKKKEN